MHSPPQNSTDPTAEEVGALPEASREACDGTPAPEDCDPEASAPELAAHYNPAQARDEATAQAPVEALERAARDTPIAELLTVRDPRVSRRRARRLGLAIVALLVGFLAYAARTDALLRPLVDARLEAYALAWNGRVDVGDIRPSGLSGVALHDVTFRPHRSAQARDLPLVQIAEVVVRPRLRDLLRGEATPERIVVRDLRVTALLDSSGGPLDDWIDWAAREARTYRQRVTHEAEASGVSISERLPAVRLVGGFVTLDDVAGRYPSAGFRIDDVRYTPGARDPLSGSLRVEGLGRAELTQSADGGLRVDLPDASAVPGLVAYALPADADATLGLRGVEVSWPPRVTVEHLELAGLGVNLPESAGVELRAGAVDRVTVALDPWGVHVELEGLGAVLRDGEERTEVDLATLDFDHAWDGSDTRAVGTLHDRDRDALHFDIERRDGGEQIRAHLEGARVDLAPLLRLVPLPFDVRFDAGTFDLAANVAWNGLSGVASGQVDVDARYVRMHAPLVSDHTLDGAQGRVSARFSYLPDAQTFVIDEASFGIDALALDLRAAGTLAPERFQLDARGGMPPQSTQALFAALPAGLLPVLEGLESEGRLGLRVDLSLDTERPQEAVAEVEVLQDDFRVTSFGDAARVDVLNDAFTMRVTGYEGVERDFGPGTGTWASITELPPHAYRAVIAAEDDAFWMHDGFDERAIRRAIEVNLTEGRIARGGSTITQQLVKNLFLGHERTASRKLQEAFLTWQIEAHVPKTRLLEIYLNLVHWGPGVYGLPDAAVAYFDRPPEALDPLEAVYLAAILPNPNLYAEHYVRGDIPDSRIVKMEHILANLNRGGYLSDEATSEALGRVYARQISRTPPPPVLGQHEPLDVVDSTTGPPVAAAGR